MMLRDVNRITRAVSACALAGLLLSCAAEPGIDDPDPSGIDTAEEALQGEPAGAQLQHEISQVLWGCYGMGADLVGSGDVEGAKSLLRRCYTDDLEFQAIMPPAYSSLNFTTTGGADGFVDAANQLYRSLGLVRTQHLIGNIVVRKTGLNSAIVTSAALAVHVYADEHVFNATIKFVDDFRRVNGAWKMTHRVMNVTSVTQAAAWAPGP
jgi:hypothetical protein